MTEQEILDNAPKGATLTCTICEDKQRLYIDNLDMLANGMATFWTVDGKEFDTESRYTSFNDDLRSLSDIKRIAELETDIHNLQRNLEAKDQGRCRTINEMSGMIRNLQEKLKAAQSEWISVDRIKKVFDGMQSVVSDEGQKVAINELLQYILCVIKQPPAPPEK